MNKHAKLVTAQDHEIISLKRLIDQLQKENHDIKEYMIAQEDEFDALQNRTGWDKFNESLLTLGQHRIDDAIKKLLQQRHLYDEDLKRVPDLQFEAGRRRSTTLPSSQTQPEIKKTDHGLGRGLKRVESIAVFAIRFTSLFKKNKKGKYKEKVSEDGVAEGEGESMNERLVERAKATRMKVWEERKKLDYEHLQRLIEDQKIPWVIHKPEWVMKVANHEQVEDWNFEKAQEEYKRSSENEKRLLVARKDSMRIVDGRQATTKESREVEKELISAMEEEYLASFPERSSIRTVHWPEGTKITGSIFDVPPSLPERYPAQTIPPQSPPLFPSVPIWTALPRTISIQPHQSLLPRPPHPTHPPPAIPQKSRPQPVYVPAAPLAPVPHHPSQAPETDDPFFFSRHATPRSQATPAAQNPRVQRLRKRRSAPSPTPRFVSYRPSSPSPGGNEPMGPNPMPSWLKTRKDGVRNREGLQ